MIRLIAILAVAAPIVALGYILPCVAWRRKPSEREALVALIDSMER